MSLASRSQLVCRLLRVEFCWRDGNTSFMAKARPSLTPAPSVMYRGVSSLAAQPAKPSFGDFHAEFG
jgi:hypothetical protein